jgi:hypothetical protein
VKTIVVANFPRYSSEIWLPILWAQAKTYYEKYGNYIQWKCKCKCGKILIVQNRYLKSTIDCGQCNKIRIDKTTFTGLIVKKVLLNDSLVEIELKKWCYYTQNGVKIKSDYSYKIRLFEIELWKRK